MSTYNATRDRWEPENPFDAIPEAPKHEVTNEPRAGKPVKQLGETAKPNKTPDYAGIARDHWRKQGGIVGQAQTVASNYVGGKYAGVTTKDLYGIVDFIVLMPDFSVVFVQATSQNGKSDHIKKILTETFKIGNGKPTSIYECVYRLAQGPCRFVLHMPFHDKPGAQWQHELIDVTPEILESWRAKREKRAGAA